MGRHRRSAAVPAPAPDHPAAPDSSHHGRARRKERKATPVRAGLLGVSAAVAVGAVAMASGLLPGGDTYTVGGSGGSDQVRADGVPDLQTQGGSSATPTSGTPSAPTGSASAHAPSAAPSPRKEKASGSPSDSPSERTGPKAKQSSGAAAHSAAPTRTTTATPERTESARPRAATSSESAAAAAVLSLVNQQRAQAGCRPVQADGDLAALAGAFSDDMAARGFFDHTDPDGATPWDRADKAGVTGLGGENIAKGQSDATAVMNAWMNSPGHRANILNCDFKTLGVGVHFGSGGPWWTQDFGF
ncbi:CAP domain-containing protein [Streptomyces sp. NBC_01267]|uniref:CAP domain-containing protein n=1 Tax=Streptomyces sp. NBC_01267 TaxID=2903805 RepID=UPI002E36E42D|nr:CAP domain-containing protein [Streptomyces sp. NBC_01267]